jgi:hypothetical protein
MRIAAAVCLLLLASAGVALAQTPGPETPIPGAGGWKLTAVPQAGCFARVQGAEVDTMLTVNRNGQMALGAGRPDWNIPSGDATVSLQIDSAKPVQLDASPVGNFFLVLITDNRTANALRKAHSLTWALPSGRYTADVTGLGAAFSAVRACSPPPSPLNTAA